MAKQPQTALESMGYSELPKAKEGTRSKRSRYAIRCDGKMVVVDLISRQDVCKFVDFLNQIGQYDDITILKKTPS